MEIKVFFVQIEDLETTGIQINGLELIGMEINCFGGYQWFGVYMHGY